MRSLLVPVEDHQHTPGMLRLAGKFAARFESHVDAVALRLPSYQAVGAEPIVAVAIPPIEGDEREAIAKARSLFDEFVRQQPADGPRFRWRAGEPVDDQELGALGRVYDLTVIGRPTSPGDGARMTTLESALFESGRPILICPPTRVDGPFGKNIVISWNQSTEGARSIVAALPILKTADKITILTLSSAMVPGPSGEELREYLATHGIAATHIHDPSSDSNRPGLGILEQTQKLGGDLLIKSAYTQSRLRQMIFGGATSQILAHAEVPVFMAN
ncbi:MAG: universal stress protein [Pseudomonadota bacterium]